MSWNSVKLGSVCTIIAGQSPPGSTYRMEPEGLPFFQGKADFGARHPVPRVWCVRPTKKAQAGDILITVRAPVGPTNVADCECCIGRGLAAIRPNKNADRDYILHTLRYYQSDLARMGSGSTFAAITTQQLNDFPIPLPPLAEQKRIAALLDEADTLRRKRRAALAKLDALLQSTFAYIFVDFDAFPSVELRDVCGFITKGTTPKPSELHPKKFKNAVPFLKVYNIADDGGLEFEAKQTFITSSYHAKELARSKVLPGDVLMNIVGPPLGKIGIVPSTYPEWNINQAIAIFRPKEKLNSLYLLHALRSPRILPSILKQAVGIRQLNLSLEQCRMITIPLPPFRLQEEFASRVTEINAMREQGQASLNRLDSLFSSLQHQAFALSPTGTKTAEKPDPPCLTLDF